MVISIHALLAESDLCSFRQSHNTTVISIHALLAESDDTPISDTLSTLVFLSTLSLRRATYKNQIPIKYQRFLSTLSLRRATINSSKQILLTSDFYPRSPCGERLLASSLILSNSEISIHALLAESDVHPLKAGQHDLDFYPRSPCGERRCQPNNACKSV